LNSNIKIHLTPFLSTIPILLKPSDTFLQIYLSKLNKNIFQIFGYFLLWNAILTCFWKHMYKTSTLEAFFYPKIFTIFNKLQCTNHCIEIKSFIFDINKFFSLNLTCPIIMSNFWPRFALLLLLLEINQ